MAKRKQTSRTPTAQEKRKTKTGQLKKASGHGKLVKKAKALRQKAENTTGAHIFKDMAIGEANAAASRANTVAKGIKKKVSKVGNSATKTRRAATKRSAKK